MSLSIQPEEQRSVTVRAPAKVNLHLGVGRPRDDGFHPLDTVFQAVGLYDDVRASDGEGHRHGRAGGVPAARRPRRPVRLGRQHRRPRRPAAVRHRRGRDRAARRSTWSSSSGSRSPGAWQGAPPTPRPRSSRWTGSGSWRRSTTPSSTWAPGWAATCPSRWSAARPTAPVAARCSTPIPDATTWWWVVVPSPEGLATPAVYRRFDEMFPDAPGHARELGGRRRRAVVREPRSPRCGAPQRPRGACHRPATRARRADRARRGRGRPARARVRLRTDGVVPVRVR